MTEVPDRDVVSPPINFARLLLVVTGSSAATSVPQLLDWVRTDYPTLRVKVIVTQSALGFVGRVALESRLGDDFYIDAWQSERAPQHTELAHWSDVIIVYPATLDYFMRFSAGIADTPSLVIAAARHGVVALAPSLPPGALASDEVHEAWARLAARDSVVLVPPILGERLWHGAKDRWVAASLSDAFALVSRRRDQLDPPVPDDDDDGEDVR